ncbi:MAG: 5-(carboxyamino)imidazole ribonucleotide synthase [Puniceicoccales bacterium]
MIQPGATIGIMGGGQLGRMSILAGRQLGYRFRVFEPKAGCAAGMVADEEINADYTDEDALMRFTQGLGAVTFEFENVPAEPLAVLASGAPVRPRPEVLYVCQNRRREKEFLQGHGFPCAPFRVVDSAESLAAAVSAIGLPCVLKTADFGYDGKGQIKLSEEKDWEQVWKTFDAPLGVLESWIPFVAECSIIAARTPDGRIRCFPLAENIHRNHILHMSIAPARLSEQVHERAEEIARDIAEALGVVGLIAVELFVTDKGDVLVNELAPRPHNSGHHTIDACMTSQFEQHIRAVCGLPLGATNLHTPAVMVNLLGDVWPQGKDPDWSHLLRNPRLKLHLYDKGEPRPGRKMGHFTLLSRDDKPPVEEAARLFDEFFPR